MVRHHSVGVYGGEQLPVSEVKTLLTKAEYQAIDRLLLAASEEYGDLGTTQKKDVKKTPAKMLPSTLSKHCMCAFLLPLQAN